MTDPILLSTEELSERLNLHPQTVRRWAAEGKIPSIPAGSKRRYDYDAVIEALQKKGDQNGDRTTD